MSATDKSINVITMKVQLLLIFSIFVFYPQMQVEGAVYLEITDPRNCSSDCCGSSIGPMKSGEEKQIQGSCERATCGGNGIIQYASCGVVMTDAPCHVDKGDLSKPYPECCPQVRC